MAQLNFIPIIFTQRTESAGRIDPMRFAIDFGPLGPIERALLNIIGKEVLAQFRADTLHEVARLTENAEIAQDGVAALDEEVGDVQ